MRLAETLLLRLIGIGRIPFLLALRPRVLHFDEERCAVLAPLSYLTRNHVGSMYFGALVTGADCAGGLHAAKAIFGSLGSWGSWRSPLRGGHRDVVPIFKTLHAEFHKLADGDVLFECRDGLAVRDAVERADRTGERVTLPVTVRATVPDRHGDEPVATFALELSLRKKRSA
jgi:hypothetical protein